MKGTVEFDGEEIKVIAEAKDSKLGKGVRLNFEANGMVSNVVFSCHPEFESYESFNNMTHKMLFELALKKLASGTHTASIIEASQHRMTLLFVINGKNT